MKRYSGSTQQYKQETILKSISFQEREILSPKTPINPIILQHEPDSESGAKQDGKFNMEELCKAFIERIGPKHHCKFEAKQLIEATGVKQRRIYDLMNILEGCGFMKRVSKGTYIWFGFEDGESKKIEKEGRKKQATSLSNLAARVKSLLYNAPNYIDFKDICQQILQESVDSHFNPDSIKRRVYECCKILKIVGLIDKRDHTFKWITKQDRQKALNTLETLKKESLFKNQKETTGKQASSQSLLKQDKFQCDFLITELLKTVNNELELESLLKKIRFQFDKKKKQSLDVIHPRRLFGDQ